MNLIIDDFGASYRSIFIREYLDKLHHRFVCKKRWTTIVMHECDNSDVFNNIMRIFHSIPEPEILSRPHALYLVCVCMCVCEQSKYVKRSSGGLQCGEFCGAVCDYMESTALVFSFGYSAIYWQQQRRDERSLPANTNLIA